ncbi:50S ribosomal protein L3 [Candidatus Vidania fulgoroideae]|uniref:Large ribosomal subunit protein uL3 n=1 Tax=Candidatus Vidania fulgoroideorum TaxID=881286 RepID=A0A974X8W2_9PROT|nr:50S ribosomal protein L3 [Candidatus Vidania fulgoroideae]
MITTLPKKRKSTHIFIKGKLIHVTTIQINTPINPPLRIGNKINIRCISKGKGFCGVIKRHKFKSNRQSHGNSKAHHKPGSIGMCQDPGRVFKGKKMPGRTGQNTILLKNIVVLKLTQNILIIKGCIPGGRNTPITIYQNANHTTEENNNKTTIHKA